MSERGYYRHPTIHGDRIIFVSEDALWEVPANGGTARRLTAGPGTPSFPALSPDGSLLAFTGRDDGPGEVYVMAADGGRPRRLTWMGAETHVVGWSEKDTILASTDWEQPFPRLTRIVGVPAEGGAPVAVEVGPARAIAYASDSAGVVIGRNSGDPSRWKRYRGGTAGTLWIDRRGSGDFRALLRLDGNLASPMWIGPRIYFLSDHDGQGNLYSCTPGGRGLLQHTFHDDYYVRFPSTDGRRIVYHAGADLFIFDPDDGAARRVDVSFRSSLDQHNRKFVSADDYMESFDLHPDGHSLTTIHRGGLFAMPLWEGAPIRLGEVSRVRHRLATWLADGARIAAICDAGGEESMLITGTTPPYETRSIRGDFGRPTDIFPAPRSEDATDEKKAAKKRKGRGKASAKRGANATDYVAMTNHRHELILVDLATGRSRSLDRSPHHRIRGVAWSPDGRWIAYGFASTERTSSIRLAEVATGRITTLTREDFSDGYPSFDPEGRYLYFVSWRTYNPVYDSLYFDLGFPKGARPYLVTLRGDIVSPFASATLAPRAPGGDKDSEDEEASEADSEFRIDLDGITDRIVAFPVPEGRYGRIVGTRRRALYSAYPVVGSGSSSDDAESAPSGVLDFWDLERNKPGRVADKVTDFQLSMDRRVIGVLSADRLRVLPASYRDDPDRAEKDEYSRETGWVDLDRIPVEVIPTEEWKQMYAEAWRLQREHFWRPDMSGIDWKAIYDRYLPLLDRVSSRSEFSDLMWEVQGELGTSHCYEMGGDYRHRPNWQQGFLGASFDFDPRTKRWRISAIPRGDSWDPANASPLAAPGIGLVAGDEIVAIGGRRLTERSAPAERLVNMAGRNVNLRVRRRSGPGRSKEETVVVRALRDESGLRYRNWVESNREAVHAATGDRVGYVHIPDMGPQGYAEFHRYYNAECVRDGLVIDVRFNRGGHVSQLLLEKLLRRPIAFDVSRWSDPAPYPDASPLGPMVALTNEHAGSDGDIFCHAFKLYELGPLIGKRTWGGVIGIWPRHALVDGTVTTQPEFASWFVDVGYDVENYGTDPDIEIENRPQDYVAGRDRQLEQAIRSIRGLLRKSRPKKPVLGRFER